MPGELRMIGTGGSEDDDASTRLLAVVERHGAVFAALSQEPDQDAMPSASASTWVTAFSPARAPVVRPGKWLIFERDEERIDALWLLIRAAVSEGLLYAAKASGRERAARFGGEYVICVYTPDSADLLDVRRARAVLQDLGVHGPLRYKVDGAHEGDYVMAM